MILRPYQEVHCWLARFDDRPCRCPTGGTHAWAHTGICLKCGEQLQRCHLIEQQTLRRELPANGPTSWELLRWDNRIVRLGCPFHHKRFDDGLLVVPRSEVGSACDFAEQHGLEWYIDRRYGTEEEA